jgi:PAS domain S-box-containing protein
MLSQKNMSGADQIRIHLNNLTKKLLDLPAEQRNPIEEDLQKIRSFVDDLLVTKDQSEPKYREIAEVLSDPFIVYDKNLRLVYGNKSAREVNPMINEQALGKTFSELYPNLVGSEVHRIYLQVIETHQPQRYTNRWVRPADGKEFYFDLTIYPTSYGLIIYSKNVTEKMRAEQAQREQYEQAVWMARLPDENPNPVARIAFNGKILYCNPRSTEPSTWSFRRGESISAFFQSSLEEAIRQGKQVQQEVQIGERIYSITLMPFPNEQYVNLYGLDITERERSEEQLRIQASISEILNEPVIISDLQNLIRYWNNAAERTYGFKAAEAIGKTTRELLHPEVSDADREAAIHDLQEGRPVITETVLYSKDNRRMIVAGYSVPLRDPVGNLIGFAAVNQDITERKQAEEELQKKTEALRESEERFRVMADGTPVIIWVTNATGGIEFINQAYADFFGVTMEQVRSGKWQMLVHPDDTARYVDVFLECSRERRSFRARGRILRKDGQWRWVDSHGQPRLSDAGEYLGMAGSSLDITERIQAEEALEHSYNDIINERNRLLAVMEALPVGIAIQDQKGGVVQVNKAFEEVWGGPPPPANSVDDYGVYQAWWMDTGQPIKPEEWASASAIQKGQTVTGQFLQIQQFDGGQAFVLNSGAPIRDAGGKITGSAVAIMNITKLVDTENALRESQDRLRIALNSVPMMIYTCDRELRYTSIDQPLRGFRAEDVLGKRDEEILLPEAAAELTVAKQKAVETGRGGIQEVKVPLNGEDTYYILTTSPNRDKFGNILGLTCSAIDITDQKRLEVARQQQAIQIEVQRRLMDQREKDRYAIARDLHDGPIQTLSSTMFHIQMMKEVFPDPALHTELGQLGIEIKNSIQDLRDVMNELRPPALIHFGFTKVLVIYAEDLRTRFRNIKIDLDLAGDDHIFSDETHLTLFRILQSAINNIIRHADANEIQIVFRIEPDYFILKVCDNGCGFDLSRDFDQLTRLGHFGLVGMKERAEFIGAELVVASEPGKGTMITVKGLLSSSNMRG